MTGILNVYKPRGITSHDMVYFVRRTAQEKRVGHTGTLDPDAEGILPMLLGGATKLSDMLTAEDKRYLAGIQLGITTDTCDTTGEILSRCPTLPDEAAFRETAAEFVGEQQQIPPMYSAIKRDGQPLYKLARQGVAVDIAPRPIRIYSLQVTEANATAGRYQLDIHCSKGTYIRALCRDIGERLRCGAAMDGLVRTQSGNFTIADTVTREELSAMTPAQIQARLTSPEQLFPDLPRLTLSAELERKFRNGLRMRPDQYGITHVTEGQHYLMYSQSGGLLAIGEVIRDGKQFVIKQRKRLED